MIPHAYGVFLLDREPSDPQVGLPGKPGEAVKATDKIVDLIDRDGNRYTGTLVLAADTWTEACQYVSAGYRTGEITGRGVDGSLAHDVPYHGLAILPLAVRPRAGSPLQFAD